jgi:hypothetical protein
VCLYVRACLFRVCACVCMRVPSLVCALSVEFACGHVYIGAGVSRE